MQIIFEHFQKCTSRMNTLLSNSALRHCRREHYSLQKCRKIRDFNVDFFKFSGGIAPRTPYWGGATAPLPIPHRPRRSAPRSGPSVPPPWAPPFDISKYATGWLWEVIGRGVKRKWEEQGKGKKRDGRGRKRRRQLTAVEISYCGAPVLYNWRSIRQCTVQWQ